MSEKVMYYFRSTFKVGEKTNLVVTDPCYLENVEPLFETRGTNDGLYDVINEENEDVIGTVGVDSCTVGIFDKRDIPISMLDKVVSPHYGKLYTEIPGFKGNILLYEHDADWTTYYLMMFIGKSKDKDIKYTLEF